MKIENNDLFGGVAVIIDDEIHDRKANIAKLVEQIENAGIPYISFKEIPEEKIVSNLVNVAFVLLDWRLVGSEVDAAGIVEGIRVPGTLEAYEAKENIEFLRKVAAISCCPVFIFSDDDIESIVEKLTAEQIFFGEGVNNIFIRSKSELKGKNRLFFEIRKWVARCPSVYVLMEWEREYRKARNRLFSDFQKISPHWPKIMWRTFEQDGGNKSLALGELISRNLQTRMSPFEFKEEILKSRTTDVKRSELGRVLEGEKFLSHESLHAEDIATGDIFLEFFKQGEKNVPKYYLNIRPQCDLLRGGDAEKTDLYLVKGRVISEAVSSARSREKFHNGEFIEKINNAIVPFLHGGKVIEFLFRDLKIFKWKDLKEKRVGRLLPPHINRIQQRYALYLQRQALPAVPSEAVIEKKRRNSKARAQNGDK